MGEQKYYVFTHKSGQDIRQHEFERAPNGSYLFTKEQAYEKLTSRVLEPLMPVAVPERCIETLIKIIQSEKAEK